ncbi:hypothetical protein ACU8KH_00428 [Lachancea thermotolerans]
MDSRNYLKDDLLNTLLIFVKRYWLIASRLVQDFDIPPFILFSSHEE